LKIDFIAKLREFKTSISTLKREVGKLATAQVSRIKLRNDAETIASRWVEEIRSPLEHKYKIDKKIIEVTSEQMKKLHILSRPNNQKSSYTRCLNLILKNYDDNFILPLQQEGGDVNDIPELRKLIPSNEEHELSEYLTEAVECAEAGHYKASIIMGWCATIDKIQKKILALGFNAFNSASRKAKNQTSGKFKRWNKEFNISTLSELQTVFDTDLIKLLEVMELLDGNQSQRLVSCFQYRNHSAHPGEAPIEPAHVVSFFTDVTKIVILNLDFALK